MKTAFKLTQSLMLLFMVMITILVTATQMLGMNRREWSQDSLLELIMVQAGMLAIYFIAKLGVYACNTWKLERVR